MNKRLQREIRDLKKNAVDNVSVGPSADDVSVWDASIMGPIGTPFEGGVFRLSIHFPAAYPFKPPTVRFITPIFHPNISSSGSICLDILKGNWTPLLNTRAILLSVCSLLANPNPDDPLEPDHADLYVQNRERFNEVAREWVRWHASV